jgi:hypothetical protein
MSEDREFPAAHSTDTCWFAIDKAGEVAALSSDYDTQSTVPAGLPHAGGSQDFAWPYGWPQLSVHEWNSLHRYAVTDDSHGIYQRVKSPTKQVHIEVICQKVDPMFLQSLPVTFRETDWIVPHQLVRCEHFDQTVGPFPLGSLAQVAYVDLHGGLSPLPRSVGDPRAFFTRLADLVIWSARFHVPVNRSIRGMFPDPTDYQRVLRSTAEDLQTRLAAVAERGDEPVFELVAAGLENLARLDTNSGDTK